MSLDYLKIGYQSSIKENKIENSKLFEELDITYPLNLGTKKYAKEKT